MLRRTKIAAFAVTVEAIGTAWWLRTDRGRAWAARVRGSVQRSSLPSAHLYDLLMSPLLGGFYRVVVDDITDEVGAMALVTSDAVERSVGRGDPESTGAVDEPGAAGWLRVLEIGAGPGRLALELAGRLPSGEIVASDVDPAMVTRAHDRLDQAGVRASVRAEEADVSALPYQDEWFDIVVSTFSMHHWPQQVRGLDEIHRVLRPGGRALVYDLPEVWRRIETTSQTMEQTAHESSFGGGAVSPVSWPWGFHVVRRMVLERPAAG
jgi:SAM-dependent methyltransferase